MKRTDIVIVLDRSGSMQFRKDDHEGGMRSFLADQKSRDGDVRFTLIQFDDKNPCEVVYDAAPIADVGQLSLVPRGNTPLLDAMLRSAAHVQSKVPSDANVVCMVITDGGENCSREATRETVRARIAELEGKGWVFLFLGAGIDAFSEARGTGVSLHNTASVQNSSQGVSNLYASANAKVWGARSASAGGQCLRSVDFAYSADEREELATGEQKTSGGIALQAVNKAKFDAVSGTGK